MYHSLFALSRNHVSRDFRADPSGSSFQVRTQKDNALLVTVCTILGTILVVRSAHDSAAQFFPGCFPLIFFYRQWQGGTSPNRDGSPPGRYLSLFTRWIPSPSLLFCAPLRRDDLRHLPSCKGRAPRRCGLMSGAPIILI
ncbi:hypothetical protein L210DRAFT_64555 [Boletus edulis BED1]|uniref:Uncharacterized protein n=1 Tax=Boletus edulis BED1 TaxID=1328754 RepID=A0AAD4GEB2_BOLED|nr:hypothetical protein L210DRAFT_64555 [Boletus edulis BED1]